MHCGAAADVAWCESKGLQIVHAVAVAAVCAFAGVVLVIWTAGIGFESGQTGNVGAAQWSAWSAWAACCEGKRVAR